MSNAHKRTTEPWVKYHILQTYCHRYYGYHAHCGVRIGQESLPSELSHVVFA